MTVGCVTCGEAVVMKGTKNMCALHYRIAQMRATAKRRGKYRPTRAEIENAWPKDNICSDCGRKMETTDSSDNARTASLQHYRDGTIGIVCRSCNSRHLHMPDDTYREVPWGTKVCGKCNTPKPFSDFYTGGKRKIASYCKPCANKEHVEYMRRRRVKGG